MAVSPNGHSDESEQLAALYALGLLEGELRLDFERHLAECQICQETVKMDRRAVSYLSLVAAEREPPARLKEWLMRVARSESAADRRGRSIAGRHRWLGHLLRPVALTAAACVLAALALFIGYQMALHQVLTSVPLEGTTGSRSELVIFRSGAANVELRGLPDPQPGHLYVVWAADPAGGYQPVGSYDDGHGTFSLNQPVLGKTVICTEEPAAIPSAPTGRPILWATVR